MYSSLYFLTHILGTQNFSPSSLPPSFPLFLSFPLLNSHVPSLFFHSFPLSLSVSLLFITSSFPLFFYLYQPFSLLSFPFLYIKLLVLFATISNLSATMASRVRIHGRQDNSSVQHESVAAVQTWRVWPWTVYFGLIEAQLNLVLKHFGDN